MNKKLIYLLAGFAIVYLITSTAVNFYTDYVWFTINSGNVIFWTLFLSKFNIGLVFGIIFAVLFSINLLIIRLTGGRGRIFTRNILDRLRIQNIPYSRKTFFLAIVSCIIFLCIIMGSAATAYWKECLIFLNPVPFDGFPKDPVFSKDIAFFAFSLPFYRFLFGWLMSSFIIIAIFSIIFHALNGGIRLVRGIELSLFSRAHISILIGIILLISGIGYKLSSYGLLLKESGKFFGPGYTAVHVNLVIYNICMILSFIVAALLFSNVIMKKLKMPFFAIISLLSIYFVAGVIIPSLVQRLVVDPNELDKEREYITNNIKFTRIAYDIERIKEINFANKKTLTYNDIKNNKDTIDNIRLWDWRPLKHTYKQLQGLKQYYFFNDVDVDRYKINGKKTAVNISARELDIEGLPFKNISWQNRHLIYTHGYGVVLSLVSRITSEGQPEMLIYDIPPKSEAGMEVKRPEIYYGEHSNPYVVTNTTVKPGEFDYPWGDENKYTVYEGSGGAELDSFFRRLMFAIANKDINILISGNIKKHSRILYKRNIINMISTMTPFIDIDTDPYIVLSEGRLYWIVDAFTTSDGFPYSTPVQLIRPNKKINYIRNSIKIVIDAYNGTMNYYIIDKNDPLLAVYAKIFPGFFKEKTEMPADIQEHLRYSGYMFAIQSNILLKYHMTDPNIFYNNEDAWHIARQIYENSEEEIEPYYLVTSLPDEKKTEFLLIIPFTPYKKNNMIAFLTAKCDIENYGELKLYQLPKEKLSYGPMQLEARINQDPEISKQLTLWSQKGSNVIRGNMMAIPIEESILFIEPLYLKAERSEMPELKQVIVSFDDKIVMEENLSSAIEKLFYGREALHDKGQTEDYGQFMQELADRAYNHYTRAENYMRNGNWKDYGAELERLKELLTLMKNRGNR